MGSIKNYLELEIKFDKSCYDGLLEVLYLYGIDNLLETDGSFLVYFPGNEKEKLNELKKIILSKKLANEKSINYKVLKNQNWDDNWKKSIKPVFIKDKIIVYPSWLKKEISKYKKRILIEIDPKMSFGTGHNETTQLVLELMCDFCESNDKYALDYGCGTGILAIAGIKLGQKKIIAIDIDEDSVENAREYLEINKVIGKIKLYKKNITGIKENKFDVIYANILRNVIEDNLEAMYGKLKPGGKLFISGVLADEEYLISDSLKKRNFRIVDKRFKSEWLGIYAVKDKK